MAMTLRAPRRTLRPRSSWLRHPAAALVALVLAAVGLTHASAASDPFTPVSTPTPESELNITGTPSTATFADGSVRGFIDAHTHLMSNVGFGGNLVCGKTFSEQGIADALKDCDYHHPNGSGAIIENVTKIEGDGNPFATHDPVGWPTFKDWPAWNSLTHQQMYYRWVERAWRGGQRMMVVDAVNNNVICALPVTPGQGTCDDMATVRKQVAETRKLQAFIDEQYGGPGKGWFRIVYSSAEAEQVAREGKLAVVLGMEVSNPFGCKHVLDVPGCTRADIDAGLDEVYDLGIRSMFLCHKFDNALCGVRFDEGTQGTVVNLGNFLNTGTWWNPGPCEGQARDNTIDTGVLPKELMTKASLPAVLPVYPEGPHCNRRGLTDLGEYALKGMMKRRMLVELDHQSVKAADRTLDILEEAAYPGVISSHSWMDPTYTERVYRLGGFITQYGHDAGRFVSDAGTDRALRERYGKGYGMGMDMNGFGGTPRPPKADDPKVRYPFTASDGGGSTLDRQVTGQRKWDYNTDGVAHYGMVPDWVENLRQIGGEALVEELARGSQTYLTTWGATERWSPGLNLATQGTASASSTQWTVLGRRTPDKAADGRTDTRWASEWKEGQWWQTDLGLVRQVGKVSIQWEDAYAKDYRVQTSLDGQAWTTARTVTGSNGGLDVIDDVPDEGARYVRIVSDRRATQYGISMHEVRIYGS